MIGCSTDEVFLQLLFGADDFEVSDQNYRKFEVSGFIILFIYLKLLNGT